MVEQEKKDEPYKVQAARTTKRKRQCALIVRHGKKTRLLLTWTLYSWPHVARVLPSMLKDRGPKSVVSFCPCIMSLISLANSLGFGFNPWRDFLISTFLNPHFYSLFRISINFSFFLYWKVWFQTELYIHQMIAVQKALNWAKARTQSLIVILDASSTSDCRSIASDCANVTSESAFKLASEITEPKAIRESSRLLPTASHIEVRKRRFVGLI